MTNTDHPNLPPTLRDGEELLDLSLAQLRERIDGHHKKLTEGLEEFLTTPMAKAFREAHSAHERLMREAGLDATPADGEAGEEVEWAKLRLYREGVLKEVLSPLRTSLKDIEIGQEVARRWEGFQNGLPGLAQGLPEDILRPEPADLYGSRAEDRTWVAGIKGLVRGKRGISHAITWSWGVLGGLFGRSVPPPAPRWQQIPLRSLVRRCLLGHCPFALEPFSEAIQQHYAGPLSTLASASSDWNREWFPIEAARHAAEARFGPKLGPQLAGWASASEDPKQDGETPSRKDTGANQAAEPSGPTTQDVPPDPGRVATGLHAVLAKGSALEGPEQGLLRIREAMEAEWTHMTEEIRVCGSFQQSRWSRIGEKRMEGLALRAKSRTAQWVAWHPANLERLHLLIVLLRLREKWDQAQDDLLSQLSEKVLTPLSSSWLEARDGLYALQAEAAEVLSPQTLKGDQAADLGSAISQLLERAQTLLQEKLQSPVEIGKTAETITRTTDAVATTLSESLRGIPESVSILLLPEEPGWVQPDLARRGIPLREIALQIMDVLRLEAIRKSPAPLLKLLDADRAKCAELPSVVSYNLTSARDGILNPPEDSPTVAMDDARALVLDGLERTALAVEELLRDLVPAWRDLAGASHAILSSSFQEIHARSVVEGSVQEQILDLRASVQSRARLGVEHARVRGAALAASSARLMRRMWIRVARLVHLGKSVVGVGDVQSREAERALEVLRNIPKLLDTLPLVYRKLFSFQPVSEPSLLVARDVEVNWVARRFRLWQEGIGSPTLINGPAGVGVTSLLNVVVETLSGESVIHRTSFPARIRTEEELATHIAELVGLALVPGGWTMAALEHALVDTVETNGPMVILVEDLEHLILRARGGTDLLGAFLSLQARTSKGVFWLSTASGPGWKFFQKSDPGAAGLVSVLGLPAISRENMEMLILTRHQRSGLPIEFIQPTDLNPLVRRRLRLARGDEAKQEVLRREFFDRLFRTSEGNVSMAVLLWLRSADFDSRKGWLRVQPPRPIYFAFLEGLDISLDFALMAFLEHESLSLDEYRVVFGGTREEAYQIFEALRSRMLLEPAGLNRGLPTHLDAISPDGRYRIPPILDQVVSQRLRDRNILH